jgi:hypothetical protein
MNSKEEMTKRSESTTEQTSSGDLSHLFLRESEVQLKPKEIQISIGIDYGVDQNQRSFRTNRNRNITIPIGINYGLTPSLEIYTTMPYTYNNNEVISADNVTKDSTKGLGDVTLGLLYKLKSEAKARPAMTLSLNIVAPTGKESDPSDTNLLSAGAGFWAISTNLHISKSVDPAVLILNVGYQYTFEDTQYGENIQPGQAYLYGLGAGLSVNDSVAFSGRLSGSYQKEAKLNNVPVRGSSVELISLITSLSFRVSEKLRLEAAISLGASDDARDLTMGFSYILNL